jgi:streptogramin lyase
MKTSSHIAFRHALPAFVVAVLVGVAIFPASTLAVVGQKVLLPESERAPICRTTGNRIVVNYAGPPPTPAAQLRSIVRRMNWKIADQSSLSSGGSRVVEMAVDCNAEGEISVYTDNLHFGKPMGVEAVKYLTFRAGTGPDGGASNTSDNTKSRQNFNAKTTTEGLYENFEGWGWESHTPMHELLHTFGATQGRGAVEPKAPYSDEYGHCTDGIDVMCYGGGYTETRCPASEGYETPVKVPIDCGNDTYFDAAPAPGSYLDNYWNLAGPENPFLAVRPTHAPEATTDSPTSVGELSAVLNGTVTPEADYAFYRFEYGLTTAYGSSGPAPKTAVLGYGGAAVNESWELKGLSPGTTYHYRMVAINDAGETVYGADKSFKTPATPPSSSTEAATGVGSSEATLNGTVNPNGAGTTFQFEYGKTTSYGLSAPVPAESIGSGKSNVKVSAPIGFAVEPNTTYHYRLVATNVGGTTKGEDKTFTTPRATAAPTFSLAFGSYGSGNGQFSGPRGLAADAAGNVWVADTGNGRLQKFNPSGEYLTKFGTKGSGNGQLSNPSDVAIDAAGNLWVLDSGNSRLQKFNSSGEYLTKFGSKGSGNGQFSYPAAVAIDAAGNLWVTDAGNSRVQKFNSSGEFLAKFGSYGSGDGQLKEPLGIAADGEGGVWVVDSGNSRLQRFDSAGQFVSKIVSSGGPEGQFTESQDIAVDPQGLLWVADYESCPQSPVEAFFPEGEYVTAAGKCGSKESEFATPMGIATDAEGNLWVTDPHRVKKWKQTPYPVGTGATTAIKRTEATLNATINPGGVATSYQLEYGTTQAYGKKAPASPKSIGSGSSPVKVSEALNGLKPGTTYYYHVVATTAAGTTYGETRKFTTLPAAGAEAKWRIGGKTFAELGITEAPFTASGTYTLAFPSLATTFNCTESATGTLKSSGPSSVQMTLNCQPIGACALAPVKMTVDGKFSSLLGNLTLLESENCGLAEETILPNGSGSFEFGSEATKLNVTATHTTSYGANPVILSGSTYWQLGGAHTGKTLGVW